MRIIEKHVGEIDSTNEWAKRLAQEVDEDQLLVLSADRQTAGKGRAGRQWASPESGNLYLSIAWWEKESAAHLAHCGQALALAAVELLRSLQFSVEIKWPNDLMVGSKKLGGVLCEASLEAARSYVIAGIGINIGMSEDELQTLERPAASLSSLGESPVEVTLLKQELRERFAKILEELRTSGFPAIQDRFNQVLQRPEGQVSFSDGKRRVTGSFVGLTHEGALELDIEGKVEVFHAGEFLEIGYDD